MYTMKQTCQQTNLKYETLKFYCNQGLVPNVKRDAHNHRVFDDRDIAWINSLSCLRNCDLSMEEMRHYIALCQEGTASIPARKVILEGKRRELLAKQAKLQEALDYIAWKQGFYDDVLAGKIPYESNLLPEEEGEAHEDHHR